MRVDLIDAEIGRRARDARTRAGLTQQQLAAKVGMSRASIANIERGEQAASARTVLAIAAALLVDVHELFPPDGVPTPRGYDMNSFADWLDVEARRIKIAREKLHGGTRNRHDLIYWADALQWAARKARERATRGTSNDETGQRPDDGADSDAPPTGLPALEPG